MKFLENGSRPQPPTSLYRALFISMSVAHQYDTTNDSSSEVGCTSCRIIKVRVIEFNRALVTLCRPLLLRVYRALLISMFITHQQKTDDTFEADCTSYRNVQVHMEYNKQLSRCAGLFSYPCPLAWNRMKQASRHMAYACYFWSVQGSFDIHVCHLRLEDRRHV